MDFIYQRDQNQSFYYASLQGETAKSFINSTEIRKLDTVWFYKQNTLYRESDAVIMIAREMNYPYRAIKYFKYVPQFIRDRVYHFIANHRYRFFGKRDTCRIPDSSEKRFLD